MRELPLSLPEKKFILSAAAESKRLDGRKMEEFRPFQVHFGKEWGSCFVTMGDTKVIANVSCEVQEPRPTRPNDGLLFINAEVTGMAAPHLEGGTRSDLGVHLNRMLEKLIKESKAVDVESLCLVADEKVWALRVYVNIINHDGNVLDGCSVAALSALAHFRRPDVTCNGQDVIIHDPSERDPLPTTIHHYPVCVSFAYMEEGEKILSDPTAIEERVSEAALVLGINSFREVCALHIGGTAVLPPKLFLRCANRAALRAKQLVDMIKQRMADDLAERLKGEPVGYASCCETEKITSLSQDKVRIQLSKFRLSQPQQIPKETTSQMVVDSQDGDLQDDKQGDDVDEYKVVDLGEDTVEYISVAKKKKESNNDDEISIVNELKYGEGGQSQWIGNDVPTVAAEHSDVVVLTAPVRRAAPTVIELSHDSDEEEVVVMSSTDLEKAECVVVAQPSQQRQQKLQKHHFNKKKGKKHR